ncbi:polysaccharide deacetylase family protein [Gracilibacillus sp. S3-1-1]|uniref:Polysaccharide deacetylase family protein n=1 Tax=Gracilibacillus pellucidus TaxID=3095368 RepID=A0ACC6M703_9BACI|nr:polysaccharide deacetylase family protein [Gracilibacillus sp. S3-1-1]MDX8046542.1 polysaccharide deacetylase family protein [Gracilibacillus sp. S3-1-1]
MIKKIQFIVIAVLAILLFFVIVDNNKLSSEGSAASDQKSVQVADEVTDSGEETKAKADEETEPKDNEKQDELEEELAVNATESESDHKEDSKVVYLTFDDGPSTVTNELLDTLAKYDAKATFFMLEPNMRTHPNEVKRTVKEGHSVGSHGVSHALKKFYHDEQSALEEMKTTQAAIEEMTGVHSKLVRTPYGSIPYFTDSFRKVFKENDLKLWDWNVDSSDWNLSEEDYVANVISQVEKLDKGGVTPIILMHDRGETASHLDVLLQYLQEKGFETIPISNDMEEYSFNCYDRCKRVAS